MISLKTVTAAGVLAATFLATPLATAQTTEDVASAAATLDPAQIQQAISEFKAMADAGTLTEHLKEHPELKEQLDQLRAASDSGILATALKQDPTLSAKLQEGGVIDADGKLDAGIIAALDKVGAETPSTNAAVSSEQASGTATTTTGEVTSETAETTAVDEPTSDTVETTAAPESSTAETSAAATTSAVANAPTGKSNRTLANTGASVIALSSVAAVAAIIGGCIVFFRRKKKD